MKFSITNQRRFLALIAFAALTPLASAAASAQKATVAFSALGVSGSFAVRLDAVTHQITDVITVSLTIDGHKYKNKEVGFFYSDLLNVNYIGGVATGVDQLTVGLNHDFFIAWTPNLTVGYFSFTDPLMTSALSGFGDIMVTIKKEGHVSLLDLVPAAVQPAPSTLVRPDRLTLVALYVRRVRTRLPA